MGLCRNNRLWSSRSERYSLASPSWLSLGWLRSSPPPSKRTTLGVVGSRVLPDGNHHNTCQRATAHGCHQMSSCAAAVARRLLGEPGTHHFRIYKLGPWAMGPWSGRKVAATEISNYRICHRTTSFFPHTSCAGPQRPTCLSRKASSSSYSCRKASWRVTKALCLLAWLRLMSSSRRSVTRYSSCSLLGLPLPPMHERWHLWKTRCRCYKQNHCR